MRKVVCRACGKEIHDNMAYKEMSVIICGKCFAEWCRIFDEEKLWRNFDRCKKRFKAWLKEKQKHSKEKLIFT